MKNSQTSPGFAFLELFLGVIVVLIIVFGGYYVYVTQAQEHTKSANASTAPHQSSSASSPNPRAFYDCVDANGVVTQNSPFTCTLKGVTVAMPTTFDKSQIDNINKVPAGAQALVIALAQQNFSTCIGNVPGYPSAIVSLAQSNFVDVGVGCAGGAHTFFGLTGSTWKNLGSNQIGLQCAWVTTYQIRQSSIVSNVGSAGDTRCGNSDGSSGQVPQ